MYHTAKFKWKIPVLELMMRITHESNMALVMSSDVFFHWTNDVKPRPEPILYVSSESSYPQLEP
jgi:hypothetical protein